MEGKCSVTEPFHLFDNGSPEHLFGRHTGGPGFVVAAAKIL
jgi:hypothetical protein